MSDYLIQQETLTGLADKIRSLSGDESVMTPSMMANNVDEANIEVDTQTNLIAQITDALVGKGSADDSGESKNYVSVRFVINSGANVVFFDKDGNCHELSSGDGSTLYEVFGGVFYEWSQLPCVITGGEYFHSTGFVYFYALTSMDSEYMVTFPPL